MFAKRLQDHRLALLLAPCAVGAVIAWSAVSISATSAGAGSSQVTGTVTYTGTYTDYTHIIVGAVLAETGGQPVAHAFLPAPGPYTLTLMSAGLYSVFAYIDLGSDMLPPQPDEPFAWYDADMDGASDLVTVTDDATLTGIDIHLSDPPAMATIAGVVSYSGLVTGSHTVWIGAFVSDDGPPVHSIQREGPGPYTLTVPPGTYSIHAGLDANAEDGDPNPTVDPMGSYAHNPVTVAAGAIVGGVDVALLDPGTPPPGLGSVSGRVTYQGRITEAHNIIVVAGRQSEEGPPSNSAIIPGGGPYAMEGMTPGQYWVLAFMDTGDDMGPPQSGEPQAWYDPNSDGVPDFVTVTADGQVTGVDILLRDAPARLFFPVAVFRP